MDDRKKVRSSNIIISFLHILRTRTLGSKSGEHLLWNDCLHFCTFFLGKRRYNNMWYFTYSPKMLYRISRRINCSIRICRLNIKIKILWWDALLMGQYQTYIYMTCISDNCNILETASYWGCPSTPKILGLVSFSPLRRETKLSIKWECPESLDWILFISSSYVTRSLIIEFC